VASRGKSGLYLYVSNAQRAGLVQPVSRICVCSVAVNLQAAIFDPTNCRLRQPGGDARQLGRAVFGHNELTV